MGSKQEVFRVERRNPADPCSNVWEGFAAVDSFKAARVAIQKHCLIEQEPSPDQGDVRRMETPGEIWRFNYGDLCWRVINATEERIKPTCPECGNHDVQEIAKIEAYYYIGYIEPGEGGDLDKASCDYVDSAYSDDGEFVSYECRDCHHEAGTLAEFVPGTEAGS